MQELISVIVPVYKIEAYIGECVESLINQTYRNLEIILVNDGSPDSCGDLCEQYAKTDKRIRVLHKVNGGLSDARNHGIKEAHGTYISFIDGDDFIDISFYETMMEIAQKSSCDIIECYSVKFKDGDTPKAIYKAEHHSLTPTEWLTESNLGEFLSCVVWNKIYKRTLFDGIEFPVGRHYEDEATTYKVVYKANGIERVSSALYFYRQREGSITQSEKSLKEIKEQYKALEEKFEFFEKNGETTIAKFSQAKLAIYMISVYKMRKKLTGEEKNWRNRIKIIFKNILAEPLVPMKYKLYLLMFIICPRLIVNYGEAV